MKVLLLIAFMIAAATAASIAEKNGKLHFEADSNPSSPIGLLMKGLINPRNEGENNVQTFFRLAEQLIPLAESKLADKPGNYKFTRYWCYGTAGDAISVCFYMNAELWVGWRVGQIGKTGSYNVTYTPYTLFRAGGNASASSYPAEVSYGAYFSIVDIQIPVNLLLAQTQICYSATFAMAPTQAYTAISTNLLQCMRSVPDMTPWSCERIKGVEFKHLSWAFTAGLNLNLLPYTCINF
uniref:Uncharacterized protein n=1 Tax=Euplotes harpa TaxID=151035 RepID=A0A7S3JNU9_9SPIT|mmetsp:Transcript_8528/g.9665  ORF Transcript_8528/g.9665 Transcript_8528/m.9665 type:complete len:238 (+) Transcript_8528:29-742(+)